jgi:uncharacterized protein YceK
MKKTLVFLSVIAIFASGCASIIKGTSQTVNITSEPSGAKVRIDGQSFGATPLSVKLKKNKYDSITIEKPGYRSQTRPLDQAYDPVALLNVIWDLSTTDLITGAVYEYEPNSYHFTLEKAEDSNSKN